MGQRLVDHGYLPFARNVDQRVPIRNLENEVTAEARVEEAAPAWGEGPAQEKSPDATEGEEPLEIQEAR